MNASSVIALKHRTTTLLWVPFLMMGILTPQLASQPTTKIATKPAKISTVVPAASKPAGSPLPKRKFAAKPPTGARETVPQRQKS